MNRSVSLAVLATLLVTCVALTGCGPGFGAFPFSPTSPTGPATNPAAESIYVIQQPNSRNGNIVEFASGTSGHPTAIREITGTIASRICCLDDLAVSPAGAIVIGHDNEEVDEWSATASALATSAWCIRGSAAGRFAAFGRPSSSIWPRMTTTNTLHHRVRPPA